MNQRHSREFREHALRKVFERGSQSIGEVANDLGIQDGTLRTWMKKQRRVAKEVIDASSPRDTESASVRLDLLMASAAVSAEALPAWCRERGIYAHQLAAWKAAFVDGLDPQVVLRPLRGERDSLQRQLGDLQKQMQRKDKALAEAAALLVLSKKFQALLAGEDE